MEPNYASSPGYGNGNNSARMQSARPWQKAPNYDNLRSSCDTARENRMRRF